MGKHKGADAPFIAILNDCVDSYCKLRAINHSALLSIQLPPCPTFKTVPRSFFCKTGFPPTDVTNN